MAEGLFFEPQSGEFDVDEVSRFLDGLGHAVRDPIQPGRFVIFADAEEARAFARERPTSPEAPLPYVFLVLVEPRQIAVGTLCEEAELALARAFAGWLRSRYPCRVTDDEGNDLTEAGWEEPRPA